ncbi:MAG: hypothetical protein ABIB71_09205 [Candidatus Woesearchaeota archaeon]
MRITVAAIIIAAALCMLIMLGCSEKGRFDGKQRNWPEGFERPAMEDRQGNWSGERPFPGRMSNTSIKAPETLEQAESMEEFMAFCRENMEECMGYCSDNQDAEFCTMINKLRRIRE